MPTAEHKSEYFQSLRASESGSKINTIKQLRKEKNKWAGLILLGCCTFILVSSLTLSLVTTTQATYTEKNAEKPSIELSQNDD